MCSSPVLSKSGFIDSDDGTITLYLRKQRFLQKHMINGRLCHNKNMMKEPALSLIIHPLLLIQFRVVGEDGAYPSCHREKDGVHTGQVTSVSQDSEADDHI